MAPDVLSRVVMRVGESRKRGALRQRPVRVRHAGARAQFCTRNSARNSRAQFSDRTIHPPQAFRATARPHRPLEGRRRGSGAVHQITVERDRSGRVCERGAARRGGGGGVAAAPRAARRCSSRGSTRSGSTLPSPSAPSPSRSNLISSASSAAARAQGGGARCGRPAHRRGGGGGGADGGGGGGGGRGGGGGGGAAVRSHRLRIAGRISEFRRPTLVGHRRRPDRRSQPVRAAVELVGGGAPTAQRPARFFQNGRRIGTASSVPSFAKCTENRWTVWAHPQV